MSFEIQCFEERLRGERGEKVEGKNRRDEEWREERISELKDVTVEIKSM